MLLEVSGLTTRYGVIAALRDASLSVGAGEIVGLIGPNGAGKTTLLDTIAGLLSPAAGRVVSELRDRGRTLLIVEQNAARMLEVADRAHVLRSGVVVAHGSGAEVLAQTDLLDTFVRGSAA